MTAKEYILSQLNALKAPFALDVKPTNNSEMVDAIFKFLFQKSLGNSLSPRIIKLLLGLPLKRIS
jgi:hypothetical protein